MRFPHLCDPVNQPGKGAARDRGQRKERGPRSKSMKSVDPRELEADARLTLIIHQDGNLPTELVLVPPTPPVSWKGNNNSIMESNSNSIN